MSRKLAVIFLMVCGLAAGTAWGSEAVIRKVMQTRFPDMQVESVNDGPICVLLDSRRVI